MYENIRNAKQLNEKHPVYPKQFTVDMETMITFLLFIDGPISLILTLHHFNSRQQNSATRGAQHGQSHKST